MRTIFKVLLKFFFNVETKLDAKAAKTHGVIVCNHQSFLDGILLGAFLPQKPVFVVNTDIANRWYFKPFLKLIDHVTVDPLHPMAIKMLTKEVIKGRTIVIFPEGRITLTGSFMKIYEGAAFVAHKAKVPLIPVILDGAEYTYLSRLKGLVKQRLFTPITITMGAPLDIKVPEDLFGKKRRQYLAKYTHDLMMDMRVNIFEPTSLFDTVLLSKQRFGGDAYCIEDIQRKPETYDQFITKILGISRIVTRFTSENERVGVLLPNAIGSMATVLALNLTKRVSALLNYTAGVDGMAAAITAAEVKTILTSRIFLDKGKLEYLVEAFPEINWVYAEDLRKQITNEDKLWVLKAKFMPKKYLPKPNPDDEAVVLFTSGSEGKPKGVVHTNRSLLTNVEQLCTVADFTTKDVFMSPLPIFHAFGLTAGVILPLRAGCKIFLYPSPLHYRVIPEIVYDIQATVLFGTSTFLQNYAKYANPYDFTTLRYTVAGAERLSESVRDLWMDKFGIRILEGYGATECSPVVSINVPMSYKEHSIGRILPGMDYELEAIDGIAEGGKLVVKGKNVMKGYLFYDRPGQLVPSEYNGEKGWYDTGDVVAIDNDGYMAIKGRVKRFAKIAGEMVTLETTERLFKAVYAEDDHAAVVRKDPSKGEAIVLFTTQKDVVRSDVAAMAKSLGMPELAVARDVRTLVTIPLLGSGKIDYVTLTKMAQEV